MSYGYIYIRIHTSYDKYNVCKIGKTINLSLRNSTYKTSEVECGFFELVIEIQIQKLDIVERLLQNHFTLLGYHYYLDGGTEFFKKDIISLIIPYLQTLNLQFTILSNEQIKLITWKNSNIKKIFNKININNLKNILKFSVNNKEIIIPRQHQINVLLKIDNFYKNNNIGKIIWSCGLGKALLGILIVIKLKCKLVLIGVPSIYLQKQMKNEIMRIYNNHKNILYIGGYSEKNDNYTIKSTNNEDDINKFINKKSKDCKFIITTYDSCDKLLNYKFDFKIGDESHHLVGCHHNKTKESFHKIKATKTLFMTATEKIIDNKTNNIYSMDDENIFGKYIDIKTINWAIENKKITDYHLIILKNTEEEINNIINSLNFSENEEIINHKDLFLSAFMALKSIEKYNDLTHILIYTNKTENSELVKKYIDVILKLNILNINKENYYNKALHSNSNYKIKDEITKFENAKWGIISSVYIFVEGFDCPRLNGVIFSENMESDIRIVQSTLRPNRLDSNFPDKKAYVIIPYIDTENFITDNNSFDKCRKIISKIRNVDEKISQKINVLSLNHQSSKLSDNTPDIVIRQYIKYNIIENISELEKIKLRLRYSYSLSSIYSHEQDEYNYIRQLNKELNIQSKEEYVDKVIKDKHKNYIENPEEYFKLKGVWSNWYDFIGVDTKKFIQDKNDWINFCKENNIKSLEDYNELCKLYDKIPINPVDFYKNFSNILKELGINRNRR
jgi:predicted helicase